MKIDLHVHTVESDCSVLTLSRIVKCALSAGLDGVAVCDHEKPAGFDDILLRVQKEQIEKSFNVRINPKSPCDNAFYIIPGVEYKTPYGHILGLFTEQPSAAASGDAFERIRAMNGITVLAHPFEHAADYRAHLAQLETIKDRIDLVEISNSRASYKIPTANEFARRLQNEWNKPASAGSDAHWDGEVGNCYISADAKDLNDLKSRLLDGRISCHGRDGKRVYIAKSQWVKNKGRGRSNFKTAFFYLQCFMKDMGNALCGKSN